MYADKTISSHFMDNSDSLIFSKCLAYIAFSFLSYSEICRSIVHITDDHVLMIDNNSPDNSPDEASPGGLARPLESIGRGSSKERLIIVVHPL